MKTIYFNKFYKSANILSLFLILCSLLILIFKGLNYGVDFKGGTLIELRVVDQNISITNIRDNFNNLNLKGVKVKKFGNDTDYIVKFQSENLNNSKFISDIKNSLEQNIGNVFECKARTQEFAKFPNVYVFFTY